MIVNCWELGLWDREESYVKQCWCLCFWPLRLLLLIKLGYRVKVKTDKYDIWL